MRCGSPFTREKLYWCFADPQVTEMAPGGERVRRTVDGWKCSDVFGQRTLFVDSLRGSLTQVQGFRGTICKVHEQDYLLSRINGEVQPDLPASF